MFPAARAMHIWGMCTLAIDYGRGMFMHIWGMCTLATYRLDEGCFQLLELCIFGACVP